MPKNLKMYSDPMKALEYRNRQRKQNYAQTQGYSKRGWTESDVDMILCADLSDRDLFAVLRRSVQSIQIKRSRVKAARR